jgi:hypothetical protein
VATIDQASDSQLAEELNRADIALAIGFGRAETRRWKKYRRAIVAELDRRYPDDGTITDAELQRELADLA